MNAVQELQMLQSEMEKTPPSTELKKLDPKSRKKAEDRSKELKFQWDGVVSGLHR